MAPVRPNYIFTLNDPYDRNAPIQHVVPQIMESKEYMRSILQFDVRSDAVAVWYLGQNGFILKTAAGPTIGIDLYLTNSCASTFASLPFRLDRQLPVFIEPEDLDLDFFITTHSHQDHADHETIGRMKGAMKTRFLGPIDSLRVYRQSGIDGSRCHLLHPGERVELAPTTSVLPTFALPTDNSDLNHIGVVLEFDNGITFYNSGDTAYSEMLMHLLPTEVDICAICINGGFYNLAPMQAANILKYVRAQMVIPCHYDMMVNNVGYPESLKVAMDVVGVNSRFTVMRYYEPLVYSMQH